MATEIIRPFLEEELMLSSLYEDGGIGNEMDDMANGLTSMGMLHRDARLGSGE